VLDYQSINQSINQSIKPTVCCQSSSAQHVKLSPLIVSYYATKFCKLTMYAIYIVSLHRS